jgi:hypothetical protein
MVDRRTYPYRWMLGTVTAATHHLVVRWDDTITASVLNLDDQRVIAADDVPIDERWWLPQSVRDQLVRQEAAGRLIAMWEIFPGGAGYYDDVAAAATLLNNLLSNDGPQLAAAARRLLAAAPAPALTSP